MRSDNLLDYNNNVDLEPCGHSIGMCSAAVGGGPHLVAEVGLGEAVAGHDLDQVLQDHVEDLVELLPHDGQRLLGREGGRVQLHLGDPQEDGDRIKTASKCGPDHQATLRLTD